MNLYFCVRRSEEDGWISTTSWESAAGEVAGKLNDHFIDGAAELGPEGRPSWDQCWEEAYEILQEACGKFDQEVEQDGVAVKVLTKGRIHSRSGGELPRHIMNTPSARAAGDDPRTAALEARAERDEALRKLEQVPSVPLGDEERERLKAIGDHGRFGVSALSAADAAFPEQEEH